MRVLGALSVAVRTGTGSSTLHRSDSWPIRIYSIWKNLMGGEPGLASWKKHRIFFVAEVSWYPPPSPSGYLGRKYLIQWFAWIGACKILESNWVFALKTFFNN